MKPLGKLVFELRRDLSPYVAAFVLLAISAFLLLLVPPQVGKLLASFSSARGSFPITIALRIGGILLAQSIVMSVYSYIVGVTAEKIGNRLRSRFFANLLAMDLHDLGQRATGEIASEFSSDVAIIQTGLSDGLVNFARHVLVTVGAAVAMAVVDPLLALLTLVGVLLVAVLIVRFTHLASKAMLLAQAARADAVSLLVEAAASAYVIKAYERRAWFSHLFDTRLRHVFSQVAKQTRLLALINPVTIIVLAGALLVVLDYGNHQLNTGALRASDLISYLTYALVLVTSVSQIGITYSQLKQSALLLEKNRALLGRSHAETEEATLVAPIVRDPPAGLCASHVTLTLTSGHTILRDVSCSIPAGNITIVSGESGAGKSTLVAALAGIVRLSSGGVTTVGGAPLRPDEIAIVPQNPFLFGGTIRENIIFGRDWISADAASAAARSAHIIDFIQTLPDGFDHVLNEGGRNLSRGQQQRISLARALAGRPSILILDEATASLDAASELAVKRALIDLKGRITMVVVAHYGSLRALADWQVTLGRGEKLYEGAPREEGSGAAEHHRKAPLQLVEHA